MSTQPKDGGPAFPEFNLKTTRRDGGNYTHHTECSHGMSLRDWFAGQVIGHLISNSNQNPDWIKNSSREEQAETYARNAYDLADAMLKARER